MVKVRGELKCLIYEKEYKPTQGKQSKGKMTSSIDKTIHIPEYDKFTTTVIKYTFNEGIRAECHPHPGMKYKGELFTAYLPNNKEGSQLLNLLKKAFDKGLLFGIAPREILDTIDWKDIDHKTSVTGGPEINGYPDPDYLKRLRQQLASKGIK
ncbi:putative E3 ubiquitin-protein ligase DTX3 [Saccoglossus kowalevskii]